MGIIRTKTQGKLLKPVNETKLIIIISFFLLIFANFTFFSKVTEVYPFSGFNILFVGALAIVLFAVTTLILTLFCSKYTTKPLLILFTFISAFSAYFMYTYNVVIDSDMIQNATQTNLNESADLFSWQLVGFVLFLAVLPSIYIYKQPIVCHPLKKTIKHRLITSVASVAIIAITILSFGPYFASFFREHKPLRFYTNPTFPIYNAGKLVGQTLFPKNTTYTQKGLDAKIVKPNGAKRELVIMVVGESARGDHFSLNGYYKDTNPRLKNESNIVSFPTVESCGTSTAVSVPCMFSFLGQNGDNKDDANAEDNVLDVLKRAGVSVLWRDNNSDSKGVATHVEYADYKTAKNNTICDEECRDKGMLVGLQQYIDSKKSGDILIVLHQMGNHGPAYYKRYPKEFEKFKPTCKTNQLEQCSKADIANAYDNALLYTDSFLGDTIDLLKKNNNFNTKMLYVSDHGESLGEAGVYLHGMPKIIAPKAQTHVGMVVWGGDKGDIDRVAGIAKEDYTHFNLPHMLLGMFNVKSEVYNGALDMLNKVK